LLLLKIGIFIVLMAYFYSDLDKKIYIKQSEGSRLSGKEKKV